MTTEEENCNARGGSINLSNGFGDRSNDKSSTVRSSPIKEEDAKNVYGQGGRLKFFKDGKFILEIERACNGEKMSWVSVPRKTFWPPQGTAISNTYKESSTSLSVSDDNSSVQSSPWQRDHSWKQTNPKRNLSKELCFFFRRNKWDKLPSRRNPRRLSFTNLKDSKCNNLSGNNSNKKFSVNNNNNNNNNKKKLSLMSIVQMLNDKVASSSTSATMATTTMVTTTPNRLENVVSPRKRFLREMESNCKLQLDDFNQKRIKNKSNNNNNNNESNGLVNKERTSSIKSSYSITSLLADNCGKRYSSTRGGVNSFVVGGGGKFVIGDDDGTPSHLNTLQLQRGTNNLCPNEEFFLFNDNIVDRLRHHPIEFNQLEKKISSINPYHCAHPSSYLYAMPHVYQYAAIVGVGRGASGGVGGGVLGGCGGSRGGGIGILPPLHPITSLPIPRPDVPSCSWTGDHRQLRNENADDVSDLPLNLSNKEKC